MKKYIAFLRGINVSGKNKIQMSELKAGVEELGFENVKTYLNSGNVIFSDGCENNSHGNDVTNDIINSKLDISNKIKTMIKNKFNLEIPVFVIIFEELKDILNHAPEWWGTDDKTIYDNLIFIMPSSNYEEVFSEIGKPEEVYEKIENYKNAVFWSFVRRDYTKTNWWSKTADSKVSGKITIRTANTVRKLLKLGSEQPEME